MSLALEEEDALELELDNPPDEITIAWLWSILLRVRKIRHAYQEELNDLRQRVARLEGRGVSGEQVRPDLR